MNHNTMKAKISGINCEGEAFTTTCKFTMIPPEDNNHYGTGYYMLVEMPSDKHLIDVRYEKTVDVEVLAEHWIENWFGENAKSIIKEF